ncbi:MAG: efflux RND transporter periplasmic adaptor subunit [Candidatus Eisenbacteria bacterium]|nr:efflux RND transporter periplasmic adaptor subunit [Candidatus Eisenbacteria bacterium]
MTRILTISFAMLAALTAPLLAGDQHEHGHDGHEHGAEEAHQHEDASAGHEHGAEAGHDDHEHSAGEDHAGHEHTPAEDDGHDGHAHGTETPSVAITQWTDEMELFMEYPVLAAGSPGRFIIHLTILDGFQPVRAGRVTLSFRGADGTSHEVVASELLREGIFAPAVRLPRAGAYDFDLSYRGPGATGSFQIDDFTVYANIKAIPPAAEEEASDEITFLKEQQWKIPFATSEAVTRGMKRAVWAIAEVLPAPTAYVEIVAPIDGVLQAGNGGDLALPGSRVGRGDVVATIVPPLKGEGWAASRLAFAQAERNFERARRLRDMEAISEREFEEAHNEYLARKAGHERLAGADEGGLLKLTAPIDGKIIDWQLRPGQHLQAGDRLMAVADPSLLWLKVNVYEQDFRELGRPAGAFVSTGGAGGGWTIPADEMRVLTTGGALDPATRTIPVLLEIANADGRLKIYESTPVELYAGDGAEAVAVPRTAIYEDDGMDVIFVQTGGESFAKRVVSAGPHHGGWMSILDGIQAGDRVVTRGGYHVKLASTSAEIGHGHAH